MIVIKTVIQIFCKTLKFNYLQCIRDMFGVAQFFLALLFYVVSKLHIKQCSNISGQALPDLNARIYYKNVKILISKIPY